MDNRLYEINLDLTKGKIPTLTTTELDYRETAKLYILNNSPSYRRNFNKGSLNTIIKDYSFKMTIIVLGKANIPLAHEKLSHVLEDELKQLHDRADILTKAIKVLK